MIEEIILASKSKVRKNILESNNIKSRVVPSNVDEDPIKVALVKQNATPEIVSKNLAEVKANKVSLKFQNQLVLGADSVIDLEGKIISKPSNRKQALDILISLNSKTHKLISSVCISKNGHMIWNHTDIAELTMKKFTIYELELYLKKISDHDLFAYNVYQIEGEGGNLFLKLREIKIQLWDSLLNPLKNI